MATIRTARLSEGSHTAGAATVTIYTTPAGHHTKLRKIALRVSGADTVFVAALGPSGVVRPLVPFSVATADTIFPIALDDVLEAGDLLQIGGVGAGITVSWWLSGTVYED